MMSPRWQKARILRADTPEIVGREVWVKCGPPQLLAGIGWDGLHRTPRKAVQAAIKPVQGHPMMLSLDNIELLARDENDFADSVPFISWRRWLKQCAPV